MFADCLLTYDTENFAEPNNEISILIASHSNVKVSWKLALKNVQGFFFIFGLLFALNIIRNVGFVSVFCVH